MDRLVQYSWPGNVRELENVIERAVALETSSAILPERLPKDMLFDAGRVTSESLSDGFNLDDHLRAIEADLVRRALEQSGGDRARACSLLGISARSLRYLLEKHRGALSA
jgi:two-component system response regulator PilR (NtrC family)